MRRNAREAARRDTVLLLGPRRAALSGVSTHVGVLLSSRLAGEFTLRHFEVGSEGRDESSLGRAVRLIASPFRLLVAVLRQRAAIVHLNTALTPRAYWRDLAYMIVAVLGGARVLCQIHGGPLPQAFCRGRPLLRRFMRATLSLADAIIVLSRAERDAFRRFLGATPVLAIAHAVDGARYAAVAPRRAAPGAPPPLRLLYLGRLTREKGLYELLQGFERARAGGIAAELVIAGSGPELLPLQQWIAASGLECARLAGPVQGAHKVAVLGWADVLALPSYAEGLPYALLESMAAGVPVIATRVGAIPELVVDGVNGVLVEPGDPAALAAAIVRLAGDRDGLARMSEACRATIEARYSVGRLTAQFGSVYAQLCARRARMQAKRR